MKKLVALLIMLCATVLHAQVSYWFSQWQKKGDAADAQAFFMVPGTNIVFTYATNHVIINGAAGTNLSTLATNAISAQYAGIATNWLGSNALWILLTSQTNAYSSNAFNWLYSNAFYLTLTNYVYNATNGFVAGGQTNIYATNLIGLLAGTNVTFTTNASGFLSINTSGGAGTGLTTNPLVLVPGIATNVFYFTNGSLQAISNYITPVNTNANITNGLLAYWKINEGTGTNIYDTTSNLFHGLLKTTGAQLPIWVTNTALNSYALAFNDDGSYATSPTNAAFGFTAGTPPNAFSIAAWVCYTNINATPPQTFQGIVCAGAGNNQYLFRYYYPNPGYRWSGYFGTRGEVLQLPQLPEKNVWWFFVLTQTNSVYCMYTNDSLAVTTTNAGAIGATATWLTIGTDQGAINRNFNGYISEVRIHSGYALTSNDVYYLYHTYYAQGVAPAMEQFVLKSGDVMSGALINLSGITVSNTFPPTSLVTAHGFDYIGNNDSVYVANDDLSGLSIWTVGVGAYPAGIPALSLDLNGSLVVAGGFAGDGHGITNIPVSSVVGAQTPWLTDINGGGFSLTNVSIAYLDSLAIGAGGMASDIPMEGAALLNAGNIVSSVGQFYGNGAGLTNVPTVGLTTNICVVFVDSGLTNTLTFTDGRLTAITAGIVSQVLYLLDDQGQNITDDQGNKIQVQL